MCEEKGTCSLCRVLSETHSEGGIKLILADARSTLVHARAAEVVEAICEANGLDAPARRKERTAPEPPSGERKGPVAVSEPSEASVR